MADAAHKYPENVAGKFYVDDQCIDCDLCRETAPANFTRNDDGGHSYVHKQPENEEEERTRHHLARVVCEVGDVGGSASADLQGSERGDQPLEIHDRREASGAIGASRGRPAYASGGISRYWSAKRAICWKAGAATVPPQIVLGSSTVTRMTSRGSLAGTAPTNDAT